MASPAPPSGLGLALAGLPALPARREGAAEPLGPPVAAPRAAGPAATVPPEAGRKRKLGGADGPAAAGAPSPETAKRTLLGLTFFTSAMMVRPAGRRSAPF
jgi:hypothetical protein